MMDVSKQQWNTAYREGYRQALGDVSWLIQLNYSAGFEVTDDIMLDIQNMHIPDAAEH